MATSNSHKCNCQNSNMKSSKPVQMFSTDSDVFYDVPDEENCSVIPKSSNRSRTTQNDRYRDHTHLSNEPNIEAPAGPRQQLAGQRQTYQAKDKYEGINDDNDDGKIGNNTNKEQLSLRNNYYLTPKGSCLCSNVSQDGFSNLSSEAVELSFSTNTRANLQGSYECFCEEKEGENGSCHKFWCQRYEDLGDKDNRKTVEDSMRAFRKFIEGKEDTDEQTIFDFNMKPDGECLCEHRNSKESCSCTRSCEKDEIGIQELSGSIRTSVLLNEREQDTLQSSYALNHIEQKNRVGSSTIEDPCPSGHYGNSEGQPLENTTPNLNESFCPVGTGITPRPCMDENVIPLLKSIFDVLQTMRQEQLNLGPYASRNIEIHLDEPLNGLPPRPKSSTPTAPPSSPKFLRQLQRISYDSQSPKLTSSIDDHFAFKEEVDQDFISNENNLSVLEPPVRDIEETSPRSQRLIPVDMNLLRTDEELMWEPDMHFDEPEVEKDDELHSLILEDNTPSKALSKQLPEEIHFESMEELNVSSLKQSSSMAANTQSEEYYKKLSNMPLLKKSHQELQLNQKDHNDQTFFSQAIQVNSVSLLNLNSRSAQFSRAQSDRLDDLSEEKLLKTSKINNSIETLIPTKNSQSTRTKFDVGTDCPDFDNNEDRTSIKSNRYFQEPTKPSQNQEMSQFIESILSDLKAMDSLRNNCQRQSFARISCPSTPGGWQRPSRGLSYPVTIEMVQELGANSLFVKWRVQNFGNIGGYEIFLDGRLTNRYFNCIHRAAVICDVDLRYPHRIILRAQPLLPLRNSSCFSSSTSNSTPATTHPEASCPQSDGSVWFPSVYHFEPNSLSSSSAPINAVLY